MSSSQSAPAGGPKMSARATNLVAARPSRFEGFGAPSARRDRTTFALASIPDVPGSFLAVKTGIRVSARARKGRPQFRLFTKVSLSAKDRAALFRSFGSQATSSRICRAVPRSAGFGGEGGPMFPPCRRNIRDLRKLGLADDGARSDPMTLSKRFFA